MNITIDCAGLECNRQLHLKLKEALAFPEWYGCNLDALYDCLTSLPRQTELTLLHFRELPFPVCGFHSVMQDAQAKNPLLTIHIP